VTPSWSFILQQSIHGSEPIVAILSLSINRLVFLRSSQRMIELHVSAGHDNFILQPSQYLSKQ